MTVKDIERLSVQAKLVCFILQSGILDQKDKNLLSYTYFFVMEIQNTEIRVSY